MSSKIEQVMDELEYYIESCKPQLLSSTNIIVNREEINDLLRELRMKTPEEIKRYQKIISNKEAILSDATAKADAMIKDASAKADEMISKATAQTNELVSEHEILQQAYEQANALIDDATAQAQQILDNATLEANQVRQAAVQYMDDILAHLEGFLSSASGSVSASYENLLGSLNQYQDLIQDNRRQLQEQDAPSEPEAESEPEKQENNENETY